MNCVLRGRGLDKLEIGRLNLRDAEMDVRIMELPMAMLEKLCCDWQRTVDNIEIELRLTVDSLQYEKRSFSSNKNVVESSGTLHIA
jgi:hypothetical protein